LISSAWVYGKTGSKPDLNVLKRKELRVLNCACAKDLFSEHQARQESLPSRLSSATKVDQALEIKTQYRAPGE
jgi:hypothetical protein